MIKQTALLSLLIALILLPAARANEFHDWIKASNGEHYQQTEYTPVDPKGDAYLMRKLDQVPMKLVNALIKDDYREEDIDKEEELRDEFEIGSQRSIDPDRMVNKFREIIQDLPEITLTKGQEHQWCPDAQKYLLYGFWDRLGRFVTGKQKDFPAPLLMRSKLFLLLACGWTSRYAVTGQEKALEQWILSRPDRSLLYHDLFRESYILNKGDMYLSILTCENVLAGDPYVENRAAQPVQMKLRYIRNDSRQLGDNYGAWYHFYGLMLYGIVRPGLVTRFVAETESLGSFFLEGADKQEDYINRVGAIFAKKLNRMVSNRTWMIPLGSDDRTDYMTQDEYDHSDPFKADLLITEVVPGGASAFIEVYCRDDANNGQGADLGGVILTTAGKGPVTFQAGTRIRTGQYLVLAPTASELQIPSDAILVKNLFPEISTGDCFAALVSPAGTVIDAVAWADGNGTWQYQGSSAGSEADSAIGADLSDLYNRSGWVTSDEFGAVRFNQASSDQTYVESLSRSSEMKDTNSMLDWAKRQTMTPGAPADFSFKRRDDSLFAQAFDSQCAAEDKSISDYVSYADAEKSDRDIFINFSGNSADDERADLASGLKSSISSLSQSSGSAVSSKSASRTAVLEKALATAKAHEEDLRTQFYKTSFFNFIKKSRLLGQIKAAKQHVSVISRMVQRNAQGPDRSKTAASLDYRNLSSTSMGAILADKTLVDSSATTLVLDVKTGKPLEQGALGQAEQALADFIGQTGVSGESLQSATSEAQLIEENPLLNGDDPRVRKLARFKSELSELNTRYQELLTGGEMEAATALLQGGIAQMQTAIKTMEEDIRSNPWETPDQEESDQSLDRAAD